MMKSFVFNLYLVILAWQVVCQEPADTDFEGDDVNVDFEYQDFNDTDNFFVPQPRLIQVRSNDKSYTLNFMPVNWHTAREICTAQNQVLASVTSYREIVGVLTALTRYGTYFGDNSFWIGGSQLGHIGQWYWLSTGQPFSFFNWRSIPQYDCNRSCVEMLNDGKWNSNNCDNNRPFICEDLPACS